MEMKFLKRAWLIAASVAMTSAIFSSALMAQGVDASMLRNPPAEAGQPITATILDDATAN